MMWIMECGGRDMGESRAPVGDFHTDPGKEKTVPQTQLVAVEKLRFWISFLFFFFFFWSHHAAFSSPTRDWRKIMTNLDSILKSRDITLPTKVRLVKAMVFPVAIYGCESWTIKKAERRRIDASELGRWRRLLRIPWTPRRSNQSILKEISPEYSLERLMLKLKLQYFSHLLWRTDSFEKTLMLGKIEGRMRRGHRGWDDWMASLTQWTWVWVNSGSWW